MSTMRCLHVNIPLLLLSDGFWVIFMSLLPLALLSSLCRGSRGSTTPPGSIGMEPPSLLEPSPPSGRSLWPSSPSGACCPPSVWALSQSGWAGRAHSSIVILFLNVLMIRIVENPRGSQGCEDPEWMNPPLGQLGLVPHSNLSWAVAWM